MNQTRLHSGRWRPSSAAPPARRRLAAVVMPVLLWCSWGLLSLSGGGCNLVGAGTYIIHGPAKDPAEFTLPQKTTVVFIDDRANVLPRSRLIQQMALRTTNELLKVAKVVPAALDPSHITREAARETTGRLMAIDEIGRKVNADVVIYAAPRKFSLADERGPVPTCILDVKVVDCQTGERLWPGATEAEYHTLTVELAYKSPLRYEGDRAEALAAKLAEVAGLRLAQLFFAHEKNPLDAQVQD